MFVTNLRLNTNAFSVVNALTGLKRPHSLLLPLSSPSLPPPPLSSLTLKEKAGGLPEYATARYTHEHTMQHSYTLTYICFHCAD